MWVLNDVYCLKPPSKHCWIIGEFGYIFQSKDSGRNWTRGAIIGDIRMDPIGLSFNQTDLASLDEGRLAEFAKIISDQQHLNIEVEAVASAREARSFGKENDPFEFFEILDARALNVRSVLEEAGNSFGSNPYARYSPLGLRGLFGR